MAKPKHELDPEDFPEVGGSGIAEQPMPPTAVVERMAASLPQVEPEQLLGGRPDPLYVAPGKYKPHEGSTVRELVDAFLASILSHPDASVLRSVVGGQPTTQQSFRDTPLSRQHTVELRLVYRDPTPAEVASTEKQPWKWADLCKNKQEPSGRAAEQVARQPWVHDHLVQKKPKTPVEANAS